MAVPSSETLAAQLVKVLELLQKRTVIFIIGGNIYRQILLSVTRISVVLLVHDLLNLVFTLLAILVT